MAVKTLSIVLKAPREKVLSHLSHNRNIASWFGDVMALNLSQEQGESKEKVSVTADKISGRIEIGFRNSKNNISIPARVMSLPEDKTYLLLTIKSSCSVSEWDDIGERFRSVLSEIEYGELT